MKRYDSKLYEMLKDVDSLDISIFPTNETKRILSTKKKDNATSNLKKMIFTLHK